jgi:hydroxypyruvate isomerase
MMPKFAANLTMMFNEVLFPQRFAAAARAGFKAVEFLFPYDHSPAEVAGWLRENELESVLFNLPPGDWASGERGLAALPGRETDFRASVARALEYALAMGTPRVCTRWPVCCRHADQAYRTACRETYLENLAYAARELAKHERTLLIEPINGRDMPRYFLNSQADGHIDPRLR